MKRIYNYIILAVGVVLLAGGCKTTEKNYRQAYEKAQQKARDGLEEGVYELMVQESLPPYRHTATDSVRVMGEHLLWQYTPETVDSGRQIMPKEYNLAVAKYSMLTNAKAHADRLAGEGWRAVLLRNGEPLYYVVVKMSASLDTIAGAAHEYARRYPGGCVAMPEPIAIVPSGYRH